MFFEDEFPVRGNSNVDPFSVSRDANGELQHSSDDMLQQPSLTEITVEVGESDSAGGNPDDPVLQNADNEIDNQMHNLDDVSTFSQQQDSDENFEVLTERTTAYFE